MRIAPGFLGLFLPGLAWWLWFGEKKQDGGEALARIFAVSFGAIAALSLGFYTIRVSLSPLLLGILLGLCFLAVVVGLYRHYKTAFNLSWLIALAVLGLFVAWRLWQASDLVFPNWVDSQHHVLIIRKIIENGGLPSTLEPYLPGPFYYHFAFHAVTAVFSVLSGLAPEQAVLLLGQVMSAMVGVSVYALAKSIGKDWRVGLLAALFVTFVTKMPGYYLSWGRYTLLIGVMILPVAMAEAETLRKKQVKWWQTSGLFLLTAGTLLSHYLAAFLLAIYLLIMGIEWIINSIRAKNVDWQAILTLAAPALLALVVSLRWYIRVWRYSATFINKSVQIPEGVFQFNSNQLNYLKYILSPEAGYVLIGLALFGLIWALFKGEWRKFAIWSLTVAFFTAPFGIMLFSFRSDYYGLVMFIVLGVLSAALLVWIFDFVSSRVGWRKPLTAVALVLALALVGWGAWSNADAVNNGTVLVTEDDAAALEWIARHTPEEARFFVNTTTWGYGLFRGTDGGGWILPTTGRWSLAPTTFYPYGLDVDSANLWTDWAKRASKVSSCETDFWELVEEADLNYVYVRQGTAGIQARELAGCERISKLYDNDSVSIWMIDEYNADDSSVNNEE